MNWLLLESVVEESDKREIKDNRLKTRWLGDGATIFCTCVNHVYTFFSHVLWSQRRLMKIEIGLQFLNTMEFSGFYFVQIQKYCRRWCKGNQLESLRHQRTIDYITLPQFFYCSVWRWEKHIFLIVFYFNPKRPLNQRNFTVRMFVYVIDPIFIMLLMEMFNLYLVKRMLKVNCGCEGWMGLG